MPSFSSSDLSTIERALSTAEDKIAKLLKVKEKLVAVQVRLKFVRKMVS